MSACSSIAVTGQCRSCACVAVSPMPVRSPLARSSIMGGTENAYTSVSVRSLREAAAPSLGCALQRECQLRCPAHDATVPRQGKDAGKAQITDNDDSSMSNAAYWVLHGQRSCSPQGSSLANRRSLLPHPPGAVSVGSDRHDSVPTKEAVAKTLVTLPQLPPTKVKVVEESASVLLSAHSAIIAADLSPAPFCTLHLPSRLSYPLRCGRRNRSNSELSIILPPRAPILYAEEVELPVCIDPEGVRCCPLLDLQCEGGALADEQINLSPFLNWKFVPYLPPQTGCRTRPTVVLDMDETLLHTSVDPMPDADAEVDVLSLNDDARGTATSATSGSYKLFVKYRPHLKQFLLFCVEHFEVVIFTASKAFYAHAVLRKLQEDLPGIVFCLDDGNVCGSAAESRRPGNEARAIKVLHRDHCTPTNVGYTKDLHLIGRDLHRTILVDNNKACGIFQPYNMVHVKDFVRRRCAEKVPDQQLQMVEAQLHQLRRMIPASSVTAAEDATASPMLSASECSTWRYDWEDREDTVLLCLCAAGGLLHRLSHCDSVPSFMQRTVRFNCTVC